MKIMKKNLSILLCFMLAFTFSAIPMLSAAQEGVVTPNPTPTTTTTSAPTTTTTTKKTTTTTKGTTATTSRRTTTQSSSSSSGKLTVSSKRSESSTGEGGKVTVIYTIKNTGDVTAKSIKLRDTDIAGSKTIETISSLAPGETKTVEYEATMTRDSTSEPTVTCTMNGSSRSFTGETVTITLRGTGSALSATLTTTATGIQPNTPVKFSLLLKNDNSGTVSDISISDYAGKTIKSGISLNAGSTTNVDFELTLTGDTNVYVTVKGKNSDGSEVSSKSNELAMKVDANAVPVTEGLTIFVKADKTDVNKGDEVQLTLEVKNLMPQAYTNVTIIDKASGANLQTISLLSGNDSKTYTSTITIEENTSFLYEATATYDDGTAITVQSNSLEIKVGGGLFSGGMTIIIVIVAIVVILIIATSITLYVLSKKEKEKQKSLGAAQSEKYRKSTPKKKSRGNAAPPPPQQPLSTFTIDENDMGEEAPNFDTADIHIPGNSNSFDNYGANSAFDASNLENTNPNPVYGSQSFEEQSHTSVNEPYGSNAGYTTNEPSGYSNISYGTENSYSEPVNEPVQPSAPQQETYNPQPQSRQPMNYNDLDPD